MFNIHKNSKKQGDHGLGSAINWCCENGYTVSLPLTDSQDYDMIVDIENVLLRVQVKTSSFKTKYGIYNVSLSVKGGNRSSIGTVKNLDIRFVDALFILTDNGDRYFIPVSELKGFSNINLGKNYQKNKILGPVAQLAEASVSNSEC